MVYDIIVFGGGIAGLWLGNVLAKAGYNLVLIENDKLGGGQTLASQGMIHGGQKYVLQGALTSSAKAILRMPERWQASFDGKGDVDLTGVRFLSETQLMWPAGSIRSAAAVWAAARLVNAKTRKLPRSDFPEVLRRNGAFQGPVYSLPEKVLDVRSLVRRLAKGLEGRVFKGEVAEVRHGGEVVVSGHVLRAQFIIFTAGVGNEFALDQLQANGRHTQRRPLRQVMVRPLPSALFGHGIAHSDTPRITVTSHLAADGRYIWYFGGNIAEKGATLDESAALQFARKELGQIFPELDWRDKEWATWLGDRAEPFDPKSRLPPGPHVERHDRILVAWPTKLTFVPALSDRICELLAASNVPRSARSAPPSLPPAEVGSYPWETANWRKVA
jgi:glycine/D-amino acid oxidase-like deaminating enzyme